jgi:hypothetical protein
MILLRQEPDSPALQAELMRACKANLLYDGQSEHYRAPYLRRLIQATGQQCRFWDELSHWLGEVAEDDDSTDTAQAFYILCLLAADDASLDRSVLYDFIGKASYDMTGVGSTMAFIRLEGIPALLHYVRRFAAEIADPDEAWSISSLVEALDEREGPEATAAALEEARATCPELDRLLALDIDAMHAEPAEKMDYAAAREALAAGARWLPRAWVRHASPEEFAQAAQDLLAEQDVRKLHAYLHMFRLRNFPAPAASLFPLVRHEDRRVARDAAHILGRLGGSGVRELALELLDEQRLWDGIEMLQTCLEPGDFLRIGKRLDGVTLDADGWHYLGMAVFTLLREMEAPPEESRAVLLRLYEDVPCSFCRGTAVSNLVASGGLPDWMAEECRYDAEPETADEVEQRGPVAS